MMNNSIVSNAVVPVACALVMVMGASSALGQFGGLRGAADKLKRKVPNLLGGDAPVSTSLSDAKWGDASKDGFTPAESPRDLTTGSAGKEFDPAKHIAVPGNTSRQRLIASGRAQKTD